jgi:hypothetical protein
MTVRLQAIQRPVTPHFSSGPCAKRPGWSLQVLTDAALGRSHRATVGKAKLKRAIDLTREILQAAARRETVRSECRKGPSAPFLGFLPRGPLTPYNADLFLGRRYFG